jgi:bifunctional DNA-binding transcriptional regulator/antitoxin component of YhaV-PrlF toxin-antitoxin module
MAIELTVTAKGQVTLRQSVLEHLGVGPGQKLGVALLPGGRVELRPADDLPAIADLRGALHRPGQRVVSLQEMQEVVEHGHSAPARA